MAVTPARLPRRARYDAVVIGSGPNGLSAALTLARAGRSVLVLEARESAGGGLRTAGLTLPGFQHDVCSTSHPLAASSAVFKYFGLEHAGLTWIHPPLVLAHPFDDGTAAVLERSLDATAQRLGADRAAYGRMIGPLVRAWPELSRDVLAPLHWPAHPLAMARFGLAAMQPAAWLVRRFRGREARALFAGLAAHAIQPLEHPVTGAFGLLLAVLGHAAGWPASRGGSSAIAEALVAQLSALGGEVLLNCPVESVEQLPHTQAILCDLTPRQLLRLVGPRLPERYRTALEGYRYGPGVCKVDWALSGPIPWTAADCQRAGTLHLGGAFEEIAAAERAVWEGRHPERPFLLLAQHSLFDPARAPEGRQTAWAYCHVPNGSGEDMTSRIEQQVERFAPGFRQRILARHTFTAQSFEGYNANYIGGDINGGVQDLRQLFTRPTAWRVPYATPVPGLYLCSSSTPPGGGVHGYCGFFAASAALRQVFHQTPPALPV